MNIFSFAACGVIACVLIITIKQYKPELAVIMTIAAGVLILGGMMISFAPVITSISEIAGRAGINSAYMVVVIKAIGICLVAQLAADICRDAGQQTIASKVEMAGKLGIVAVSIPLFQDLLRLAANIMS